MTREEFMDMVYSELHSDGDNYRANRIIDAADEYVETEKESNWIPISERLPESNDIVLVTLNDSYVAEASYFNQHWVYYAGEVFESNYPVAWMPLPKPYKTESEGGK